MIYVLLGVEVCFSAIFEPARNSLLPNVTTEKELLPANALSSATWSFALTAGAALGGLVTALLGRNTSFALNSFSFFVSAVLIQRIRADETHVSLARKSPRDGPQQAQLLRETAAYFRSNPRVSALVLAKAGIGLAGGFLLLLAIFGESVVPVSGHGALAVGLLYAARGAGAGVGPILGDYLTRGAERPMWRSLGPSFLVMGISYCALGWAPNLPLAMLAVFCAHLGGSNIWVISTTLLQIHTADRFRGRVFALDFGFNMLASSVSNYAVGTGLASLKLSARSLAQALGAILLLPASFWFLIQARLGQKPEEKNGSGARVSPH